MDEFEEIGTTLADGVPAVEKVEPVPDPEPIKEPEEVETPDPDTDEAETEEGGDEAPKKKSGSQRWKEKAQREAEEKEYWKTQALQGKTVEAPVAPVLPKGGPTVDQFDNYEDFQRATIRYEAQQIVAQERAKQGWEQKAQSARAKYPDFDDALQTARNPSPAVIEVLQDSPLGADIAYHLATHPEVFTRINTMSPIAAARELGKLEVALQPKPEPKKVTKAPPPIVPVVASVAAPAPLTYRGQEDF